MFCKRKFLLKLSLLLVAGIFLSICFINTVTADNQAENLIAGADAVNLKIEKHYTLTDDGGYRLHLYVKRRILTYKGKKEYADFKFTYNRSRQQVKLLKAQTTTDKGEVLTVKPEETHDIPVSWNSNASLYSKTRQMVVSLPAVEPGSTIEIEIEVTGKDGFWCEECFRLNDPILEKQVIIESPAALKLQYRNPENLQLEFRQEKIENGYRRYQWRGKNILALTPEKGASSPLEQGLCLLVSTFSNWRQVADFFNKSFTTALQAEKNHPARITIKNPAAAAIADDLYRKIRTLTTYAISFQETDFKVQPPLKTKNLGYGTDCDLALFFIQQLKLYRQPAAIVMVDSQKRILDKFTDFPYPGWWDTALVKSGKSFFRFSSAKAAPGITGFDQSRGLNLNTGKLTTVKDRAANRTDTSLTLNLENLNSFPAGRGELILTLKGSAATGWRHQWRDLSQPEREISSSQFLHQIDPEALFTDKLSITGLKDDRHNLTFTCSFTQPEACTEIRRQETTKYYLLPLQTPELPYPLESLLKEREQPIIITTNRIISDEIIVKLPAHARIISQPSATTGELTHFSWQISCEPGPGNNTLIYKRSINLNRGIIPAEDQEYKKFVIAIRSFYRPESLRIIFKLK